MTLVHVAIACMTLFGSLKQDIESDPSKWARFEFPRQDVELTIRVPDKYLPIELQGNPLQELALNSGVTLFDVTYDYGRVDPRANAQFRIGAALVRLEHRPASGLSDGQALSDAIAAATKMPRSVPTTTELITIRGRSWLHTTGNHSSGAKYDSFGTLLGSDHILFIRGNFERKLVRDKDWLNSRRDLVRRVVENAILIESPQR